MVATKVPHSGGLVVLSPLVQSPEHNVVLISRNVDVEYNRVLHVAGGEHTGIVINKLTDGKPNLKCDVALNFSVWLRDGDMKKQENRCFRFRFFEDVENDDKHATAQQFFRDLVSVFPRDYVTFLKRILKLMQNDYGALQEIEIDMQFAKENETYQMPDPKQYDSGSEVENVTIAHVQEVLEHAYPNGLSVDIIAESLRCTKKEVDEFLHELEALGVVQKLQNEWIRVSTVDSIELSRTQSSFGSRDHPTVAILTCLFVEKQSIDAIIDNSTTVHRYRSGGDSNIYTLGWIGKHRVVATKLAVIGDSREATTSAGSITTRLLGNFQHVEHVFIVGVGGGVAHYTDATRHVRLGDVVVSGPDPNSYVFAHAYTIDRATEHVNGFLVRNWNPQDAIITHIAKNMDDKMIAEWNSFTKITVDHLDAANGDMSFSKPPPEADVLAVPVGGGQVVVIPHPNSERVNSVVHVGSIGAMVSYRKQTFANEEQVGEDTSSATAQFRDKFAANYNLRAVDAGFDSVIAAINGSRIDSWALIRGIADYQHGQSRASRMWQGYSSACAAALTKTLILRLPLSNANN
uniref:SAM_MT_ERG6_SMT domain-containing protein n=1 Tax=Elaeophora elaphi TaxID=1147741 RepID=A0A0R3RT31_9BILA